MALGISNRAFISGLQGWPDSSMVSDRWTVAGIYYALDHYTLELESGTMAVAGTATGLKAARKLDVAAGAITVDGTAASLKATRKLALAIGALAVNGSAVTLTYGMLGSYVLSIASGSCTVAGQAVGLKATRKIEALFGESVVNGSSVGLKRVAKLLIGSGALTVAGSPVTLNYSAAGLFITLNPGVIKVAGSPIKFIRVRAADQVHGIKAARVVYSKAKTKAVTSEARITGV
jgi:hypothetical protein